MSVRQHRDLGAGGCLSGTLALRFFPAPKKLKINRKNKLRILLRKVALLVVSGFEPATYTLT
jgi:hypothetical protein